MITLNEWRRWCEEIAEEPEPFHGPQAGIGSRADFDWLRYVFGNSKTHPPGTMITLLRSKVEAIKEQYAKIVKRGDPAATFKKDVSAELAKGFAAQLCAGAIDLLLPNLGSGRKVDFRRLKAYGEDEGDLYIMRKAIGRPAMIVPANMETPIRSVINRIKERAMSQFDSEDWNENNPAVKQLVLDVVGAILKTVFPDKEDSGAGRTTVDLRKLGKATDPQRAAPLRPTPREPDQSMQPPKGMEV